MIGETIAHYRILEKIGEGGMGVVYTAEDTRIQRTVAVKFLPRHVSASEDEHDRILYEARAAGQLNHPNICTIYAVEETDDERFIVMEYVTGETLKKAIQSRHLSPRQTLDYGIQIADALQEAHNKEIIHRDIKTENIMVNERGLVKVMDFGLAKLKGAVRLTKTGNTVGTLAYMAPEQIDGRGADARSDIFSLGVVLYELLSGQSPFRGEHEAAIIYSIMNEDPQPLQEHTPEVPSGLIQVLHRALEKDPARRYQTVEEMLVDLRRERETPSGISPGTASASSPRHRRDHTGGHGRRFKAMAVTAALIAVALTVSIFVIPMFSGGDAADAPIPIAVISFDNQTGDPAYDYLRAAIPNLLITSLEQSPSLQVTTWERMRDILRRMGRDDVQVIDRDLGFELCRKDTVPYVVIGSVTKAGDVFATTVKVIDIDTKETIQSASARGDGAGSILQHQIDDLSRRIAEGVGLSVNKFVETVQPVATVTTASMGAYDYDLKGVEALWYRWDDVTARAMFQGAIALDSTFANAYAGLAESLTGLGFTEERSRALELAKRYSHRASEIDRLYIEASYARIIENDRDKEARLLEQVLRSHPKEKRINVALGDHYLGVDSYRAQIHYEKALEADPEDAEVINGLGYAHYYQEDYEKAIECFDRYASLSPESPNPFDSKGEVYFRMGWLDYALNNFKKAIAIRRDFLAPYMRAAYVHALKEEYPEAISLIDTMLSIAPTPALRGMCYSWKAFYSHWLGRSEEALRYASEVKKLAEAAGNPGQARRPDLFAAWIHYERNEVGQARALLARWEARASNADPERKAWRTAYCLMARALFDVTEGILDSARIREEELEALLPQVQRERDQLLFTRDELLSEKLLLQRNYSNCIELSRSITVGPLPHIYPSQTVFYNHPFQADQLARAYELIEQTDSAIAEYLRLTTFDGKTDNRRLINPLYRYRLGLLYEKQGIPEKAVEQYEKFVTLWKDAEEDRIELPDARSRLRRLKRGA